MTTPVMSKPEGSKCVYPSEEQIGAWIDAYFHRDEHRGMRYEAFLVMKAMDHQGEQDALICNQIAYSGDSAGCSYSDGAKDCEAAIRAPKIQEGESNG